jgi:hypothetical protein
MGQAKVANRLARKIKADLSKLLAADENQPAGTQDRKVQGSEILNLEGPKNAKAAMLGNLKRCKYFLQKKRTLKNVAQLLHKLEKDT